MPMALFCGIIGNSPEAPRTDNRNTDALTYSKSGFEGGSFYETAKIGRDHVIGLISPRSIA
jgi:hypothetical protein